MYIRKIIGFLLIFAIILISSFSTIAQNELNIDQKATSLNKVSILAGSSTGYNLSSKLTRAEGAAFIVRILGKANYVESNKASLLTSRFPDVSKSQWYASIVNYCSQEGIIGGYPNGNFGPNDSLSEKEFLSMLLKAMNYKDIQYSDTYSKSYEIGLINNPSYIDSNYINKNFNRGSVVEILYTSLNLTRNGSSIPLIKELVNGGAISLDKAIEAGLLSESTKLQVNSLATSEIRVNLKFNRNIDTIKIEDIKIYSDTNLKQELAINSITQSGKELNIKTERQTALRNYTIEISNLYDKDESITYTKLTNVFVGYKKEDIKSDFFRISNIEPISKNTVNVYFTQPINVNAENPQFYSFEGDNGEIIKGSTNLSVKTLSSTSNGVVITAKNSSFHPNTEYNLTVSGELTSQYGVMLGESSGDRISFTGIDEIPIPFSLNSINVLNSKTVRLDFTKEVNPVLAKQIFNFYITTEGGSPIQIEKSSVAADETNSGKSILITIVGSFDKSVKYNLMINNMTDSSRYESIVEQKYQFTGQQVQTTGFNLVRVSVIDPSTIDLYFNRALDSKSATTNINYVFMGVTNLAYTGSPMKVYFSETDPKKVRIYLSNDKSMTINHEYKVYIQSSLTDYMGNQLGQQMSMNFINLTEAGSNKIKVDSAKIISKDAIKVTFSKDIALEGQNILTSNYTLENITGDQVIKKIPLSVNYINGTTIILKFDKVDFNIPYSLRFNTLKDYSGIFVTSGADVAPVLVTMGN